MTNPLVSVIIPAYNHRRYIERAIASVVHQSYRPIELIVIDDGSTDGTAEAAMSFVGRHMPTAVVIHRPNRGAASTINQGLSMASGKFINILNSDDTFHADRIQVCVELAEQMGVHFLFTGVDFIDENDVAAVIDPYIQNIMDVDLSAARLPTSGFGFLRNQLAITTGNMFMSRTLIQEVGAFSDYKYVHDWDYALRSIFFTEPKKISRNLYGYRVHGNNTFRSLSHIAGYETNEVMRNFVHLMMERIPMNRIAPSPRYWPGVFEYFIHQWNYYSYLPPKFRSGRCRWESIE